LSTNIKGKQIIITGLSSELALQSFKDYADHNTVFGTYHKNEISVDHKNIHLSALDLTSENAINGYVQGIRKNLTDIILVNFAAYKFDGLLADYPVEEWDKTFDVNIKANFLLAKHLLPIMIANKWGRFIHISSEKALRGSVGSSVYSASKSALYSFNRSMAKEYARFGITSNIISLGYFDSGLFKKLAPDLRKKLLDTLPSKLMGRHEDVSSCFEYLVKSPFTNGETITIDGCME